MPTGAAERTRFEILRNRDFSLVWSAGVISQVGDWALSIGLVYLVYILTGSTLATGSALLAAVVPQALAGVFAGVYVDRWSRKRTMIGVNLGLALGLLPLLLVHTVGEIWIVYVVLVYESSVAAFFPPAEGALIPDLVGGAALFQANSVYGAGRQFARLAGAALGGVLVGATGLWGVTLVDAAGFVAAAILLWPIREPVPGSPAAGRPRRDSTDSRLARFGSEWRDGLAEIRRSPTAWTILILTSIVFVGEGVFGTLAAPFVVSVLHGSGADYGLFLSLQALGGIVGGVFVASQARRWNPRTVLPAGAIVFGAMDLVVFNYPLFIPGIALALLLIVFVGLPASAYSASYSALQQAGVEARYRGRFIAIVQTVGLVTMIGGILLAGFLGNTLGIIPLLEIQGGVYIAGGLFVAASLRRPHSVIGTKVAGA